MVDKNQNEYHKSTTIVQFTANRLQFKEWNDFLTTERSGAISVIYQGILKHYYKLYDLIL